MNSVGTFVADEIGVREVWMEHFGNLHNFGCNEKVIVNMFGFDGVRRMCIWEVISRVRKLRNCKSAAIN